MCDVGIIWMYPEVYVCIVDIDICSPPHPVACTQSNTH